MLIRENQALILQSNQTEPVISVAEFVARQVEVNRQRWYQAEPRLPGFRQAFSFGEQRANQKLLTDQVNWLSRNIKTLELPGRERELLLDEAYRHATLLGKTIFGMSEAQIAVLENEGVLDLSQRFFIEARKFDPTLMDADIFQASRNVWTCNYLQILLGLKADLTPAVFAYSLLYPLTDNFLDDPSVTGHAKLEFNQRFCGWLNGEAVAPANAREEKVLACIRLIEGQYPRLQFPRVYESLLAIFCAQQKSAQMPPAPLNMCDADLIGLTFEKGGTSVLADGFLAAGDLSTEQMEAIFDYGCFAQLMDDQEDVESDTLEKAATIFTEMARLAKLDEVMNRVFSFAQTILGELDLFKTDRSIPLIQVSMKGIDFLLIDACVRTRKYYSRPYLSYLESFFPVRFSTLASLQKQIKRQNLSSWRLIKVVTLGE